MASEVDIANLALSHLGDTATVASLYPPEGSTQAELAARFYPIARDSLLELHTWSFAMRREELALLTNVSEQWRYTYVMPNNVAQVVSIIPKEARDDYSVHVDPLTAFGFPYNIDSMAVATAYVPQAYDIETLSDGTRVIRTNQEQAMARFVGLITDTTKFSPLFTITLSWHLASMLAGPILKGDVGAAEAQRCLQRMQIYLSQAKTSDADQRDVKPNHIVSWVVGR
jgi:hypothetical protein